jgi:hypothetical protein
MQHGPIKLSARALPSWRCRARIRGDGAKAAPIQWGSHGRFLVRDKRDIGGTTMWGWGKRKLAHPLDRALFNWTPYDPFRVRDLLNGGCLILGRAGSGKTSSSGRMLMQAVVDSQNPKSGGLILAAKPEDAKDVEAIFRKAGRLNDLIVFDAEGNRRCNFLGCAGSPRDVVQFITTLSEVGKRGDGNGSGGDNSRFYEQQEERTFYNTVAALQAAGEPLAAPRLHEFIMTAATNPEELNRREWQAKYHSAVLERGFKAKKTALESHDFTLCADFWLHEWPTMMDVKTRGNILAGVQGTLHTMNTGIVREMVSGETNVSPADILAGKWVLVNFPPSKWGHAGLLISAGWKQLLELAILERKAKDDSPFVTIWCDEAHQFVTNFDSSFIAQCRSHKGCLVCLTQSVSSFYSAMKGEAGKHQADALLANFTTVIAHVCDPVSAKWLASRLGKKKEILFGGNSSQGDGTVWDELYGNSRFNGSFSERWEAVLQEQEFLVGRTGGPANGFLADAVVLKSGEPFSSGKNYLKTTFDQRG